MERLPVYGVLKDAPPAPLGGKMFEEVPPVHEIARRTDRDTCSNSFPLGCSSCPQGRHETLQRPSVAVLIIFMLQGMYTRTITHIHRAVKQKEMANNTEVGRRE